MSSMDHLDSYATLAAELKRQGFFRKATGRLMAEFAFHLSTFVVGIVIAVNASSAWIWIAGVAISAIGATGISTNTHTSAHFATSDHRWLNLFMAWIGYPILGQFSISYWWKKHNSGHHRVPNVIGVDKDCDFMPLFAYCEGDVAGKGPAARLYYKYQGAFLPILVLLHGFNIQTYDWRYLVRVLRDPQQRRLLHWMDVIGLSLHWVLWIIIPALFYPLLYVVLFHIAHRAMFGVAMFVMFAPAHYPAEAIALDQSELKKDPLLLQTAATVDFRTGFLGRLYCAGVEYQIEHHLFPAMSHTHYPHIAPMVQAFCRRHGYPYRTLGWGEALWKSYLTFWRPKPVRTDLEAHSVMLVSKRDTSGELRGTGYVSALDQRPRVSQ
jgi:linoleoyl-CoA desaturase